MLLMRSDFLRNIATLAGGQSATLVIPILAAPLLGRLYTPHDYGLLGGYIGLSGIFSTIGNLNYGQAIPLQATERRALRLVVVAIWASFLSSFLALIVVASIFAWVESKQNLKELSAWLWLLPAITLSVGVSGALAGLANHRRNYKIMSGASVTSAVGVSVLSIVLGLLGKGLTGLLLSYVIGQLIGFLVYVWWFRGTLNKIRHFTFPHVLKIAYWQSSYPLYSLPASVFRSVAMATIGFVLVWMEAADLAGHFSRAQSLLAMPIGVVGMALAQVFQEKAARERAQTGNCWGTYKQVLLALVIASPPAFGLLALAAPKLFVFYLGSHWEQTGYIAQLLAPMMCLRMIAGPLWPVFAISNHNHYDFWIALWQISATLGLSLCFFWLGMSALWQVIAFVLVTSSVSLLHLSLTYRLARAYSVRSR